MAATDFTMSSATPEQRRPDPLNNKRRGRSAGNGPLRKAAGAPLRLFRRKSAETGGVGSRTGAGTGTGRVATAGTETISDAPTDASHVRLSFLQSPPLITSTPQIPARNNRRRRHLALPNPLRGLRRGECSSSCDSRDNDEVDEGLGLGLGQGDHNDHNDENDHINDENGGGEEAGNAGNAGNPQNEETEERQFASPLRTSILSSYEPTQRRDRCPDQHHSSSADETTWPPNSAPSSSSEGGEGGACATAILQTSYFMCGRLEEHDGYNRNKNQNHNCNANGNGVNTFNSFNSIKDEQPSDLHAKHSTKLQLPDDPTVQESIECVFASQLEEGLVQDLFWVEGHEDPDSIHGLDDVDTPPQVLFSPAALLQTRTSSRLNVIEPYPSSSPSHSSTTSDPLHQTIPPITTTRRPRKTYHTGSLVHIGTYDPSTDVMHVQPPTPVKAASRPITAKPATSSTSAPPTPAIIPEGASRRGEESESPGLPISATCKRCACGKRTPNLPVEEWPQRFLFLRATPGTNTRVNGVRFARTPCSDSRDGYLWKHGESTTAWAARLQQYWKTGSISYDKLSTAATKDQVGCPYCMVLPINNGNESAGESLLIDFESNYWKGTMMLRLRYAEGTTKKPYDDESGYFAGMNRKYQAVISGSPKIPIQLTKCTTGVQCERAFGKLPAKWIVKAALKLLSFFAPQLEAKLEGSKPFSLTPLGSTPQVFGMYDERGPVDLEPPLEEPTEASRCILGEASDANNSLQRARLRKKAFDKLFLQKSKTPTLEPSKYYVMEFLQHLFDFRNFEMDLGNFLGKMGLQEVMDGQPLQIMAQLGIEGGLPDDKRKVLWSFDVWHSSLLDRAEFYE